MYFYEQQLKKKWRKNKSKRQAFTFQKKPTYALSDKKGSFVCPFNLKYCIKYSLKYQY